jgi:AcrR family transcriptional regulator
MTAVRPSQDIAYRHRVAARPRTRMPAAERRAAILDAALAEFAEHGLHDATTHTIARRAGIAQPYIFSFFKTKKELFLAAADRNTEHVVEVLRAAVRGCPPGEELAAMDRAYQASRFAGPERPLAQFHFYAACADPEIRDRIRAHHEELFALVRELSGASDAAVRTFFASGLLVTLAEVLEWPDIAGPSLLAGRFVESFEPSADAPL